MHIVPCQICIEREKRIEDLLSQIDMMRNIFLTPKPQVNASEQKELDAFISEEDFVGEEPSDAAIEAGNLLTGSYDEEGV